MQTPKYQNQELKVSTQVMYLEPESLPERRQYVFSYRIKIQNLSSEPIQIISRHWHITNDRGLTEQVEGQGVVGLQPKIAPGDFFEYESICPLNSSTGSMRGVYHALTESGLNIQIEIPEFYLIAPEALQ